MNQPNLPPVFSDGLRAALMERIASRTAPAARRRRRWIGLSVFAGLGIAAGAGAATAAIVSQPGSTEVTALATSITETHTGTATVELGAAPGGATNIYLNLACLSAGTFEFSDGASLSCSNADLEQPVAHRTVDHSIPLTSGQNSTTITTSPGATWTLTATYTNERLTEWAVNDNGATYGVVNELGRPDLILVIATNGKSGYVHADELAHADGTDQTFTSPEEALEWQRQREGQTFAVDVYLSDGETKIGQFVVG